MEKYLVVETIVEGRTISHPHRVSNKIVAKKGTILIAETNYNRIGSIVELRKQSGKYVCDSGSGKANRCCLKINS